MFCKCMQQLKVAVLLGNHTGAVNQKASLNLCFSSLPGVWRAPISLGQRERRFKVPFLFIVFSFLVKNPAVMTSIDIRIKCFREHDSLKFLLGGSAALMLRVRRMFTGFLPLSLCSKTA